MTPDHYDWALDAFRSWQLAIAALREQGVRDGRYKPETVSEFHQAAAGPVPVHLLDVVAEDNRGGGPG